MVLWFSLSSILLFLAAIASYHDVRLTRERKLAAGNRGESRVANTLQSIGARDRIDAVIIPARNGKMAQLDHIVLVPCGLIVLETKNWSGSVSGRAGEPEWSLEKRDGRLEKHRNPLFQAARQARILHEYSKVPVLGMVVMAGRAQHEEGAFPEGVVLCDELPGEIGYYLQSQPLSEEHAQSLEKAWEHLLSLASAPDREKKLAFHAAALHALIGPKPWLSWLSLSMVTASAGIFMQTTGALALGRLAVKAWTYFGF